MKKTQMFTKVYIDELLKKYIVPTELRNNSKAEGKTFTPGTRIPIQEANFLRLFTAWTSKNFSAAHIDIDLSAGFIKETESGLELVPVAYYKQDLQNLAVHSGDFTSCREYNHNDNLITSEFIDINVKEAKNQGYKYIITTNFIYSGAANYDNTNTWSGVQLLSELRTEKTEYININDYLFKMKLGGNFSSHVGVAVDLETMEIVIIDQYSLEQNGINLNSMANKINEYKKQYFNAIDFKENMYHFLTLYCMANEYELVEDIKEANIILSYNDNILSSELSYNDKKVFNISNNLEKIIDLLNF